MHINLHKNYLVNSMTEILKLTPEDKVINFIAQCFAFNMPFTVSDIAKYTGLKSGHVSGLLPDDLIEKISEGGANGRSYLVKIININFKCLCNVSA